MTWRGKKENVEVILCNRDNDGTNGTVQTGFLGLAIGNTEKETVPFRIQPKWPVFHRLNGTDISSWFFQPERLDYLKRLSSFFGWKFRKSDCSISFLTDSTVFLDKWKASLVTLAEDNVNNDNFLIILMLKHFIWTSQATLRVKLPWERWCSLPWLPSKGG